MNKFSSLCSTLDQKCDHRVKHIASDDRNATLLASHVIRWLPIFYPNSFENATSHSINVVTVSCSETIKLDFKNIVKNGKVYIAAKRTIKLNIP